MPILKCLDGCGRQRLILRVLGQGQSSTQGPGVGETERVAAFALRDILPVQLTSAPPSVVSVTTQSVFVLVNCASQLMCDFANIRSLRNP